MALAWIAVNPKLQAGVELINSLSNTQFALLLKQIIECKTDTILTAEELQQLEESTNLSSNNIQLIIQSIAYILRQSLKVMLKPTLLQKQLVEDLKLNTDKAEEFVKLWTNKTKEDFENLEKRKRLDKISWELNLQTMSSFGPKEATPNVRMKLGLRNCDDASEENVVFELNEDELFHLYNTLETIQSKLDFVMRNNE